MFFDNIKRMFTGETLLTIEPHAESRMDVKSEREDPPRFRRVYSGAIIGGITCKIKAASYWRSRSYSGELNQSSGRWVLFDPDRIADKIIDRDLLASVDEFCKAAIAADRQFMASSPSSFIDEKGTKWVRG